MSVSLFCASLTSLNFLKSVKGTAVETVGNLTGSDSWKTSGREEHTKGEAEIKGNVTHPSIHFSILSSDLAAEAKGYVEGVGDRVEGKKDSIVGSISGDKSQQISGM